MSLINMLRGEYHKLQAVAPTRLLLAVFCCLLFLGLALTTLTPPSALPTITSSATHSADCHTVKAFSGQDSATPHGTDQHSTDSHHLDLAAACCAWLCSAHALLPTVLTALLQPFERVPAGSLNPAAIQNPQLAHGRLIERPPRIFA